MPGKKNNLLSLLQMHLVSKENRKYTNKYSSQSKPYNNTTTPQTLEAGAKRLQKEYLDHGGPK